MMSCRDNCVVQMNRAAWADCGMVGSLASGQLGRASYHLLSGGPTNTSIPTNVPKAS